METASKNHYIIILAGGGGTRLWPKSRVRKPKQFLKIGTKQTLLGETFKRVKDLVPVENILIVTSEDHATETQNQLPGLPPENILAEPVPRGTAAAIGLALINIHKRNPDAIVVSLASDHLIKKSKEFQAVLTAAFAAAERGDYLVVIGIPPTRPDTGLGYIHVAKKLFEENKKAVFSVESFTEKPDFATAQAFLATKEYFWNASYFAASCKTFLASFKEYLPSYFRGLKEVEIEMGKETEKEVTRRIWESLEDVAIDYGIMEKAKNLVMIPGDFGWSDIGNWAIIHEMSEPALEGNVIIGDEEGKHIALDTKGCLIHSNGRLIATIGLKDLVIVDTLDAILICPKDKVQEVKKIVEILKKEKRHEYL